MIIRIAIETGTQENRYSLLQTEKERFFLSDSTRANATTTHGHAVRCGALGCTPPARFAVLGGKSGPDNFGNDDDGFFLLVKGDMGHVQRRNGCVINLWHGVSPNIVRGQRGRAPSREDMLGK